VQPPAGAGWDLSHLRAGLLTTGVLAAAGVPGAWLLRDGRAAAWVAVGLAIVAAFFSLSALAVAAAGRIGDELTLPAALGPYLVKFVLLGVLMVSVRGQPWLDPPALGLSVLVGTVAWTAVHARRVWTSRIYYVDPGPRR
jgi:ATP synthase protein I